MTITEIEILQFNPCEEAVEFRKQYSTFKEAWQNCPRGDWMLWISKKLNVELKTLTLAKVRCASTVRHLMKDQRSLNALDVALRFANGEVTRKELDDAAYAAAAAAYAAASAAADAAAADAADDVAAYAAYAAASAAYAYASAAADAAAADAAAYASAAAAYVAAYAAADDDDDVAYAAAYSRKQNRKSTADICREVLTQIVFEKLNIEI